MRIDGKTQFGMDIIEQSARKKSVEKAAKDGAGQSAAAPKAGTDAVVISGRAKETVVLSQSLRDMPEVREDKVAELKAKLANGSYNVSGRDIAEKVIANAATGLF